MTTAKTDPAQKAAANGQAPAAPAAAAEVPCEDCASPSERVMGVIGLLFAAGLAAIAIDLISGGALSRLAAGVFAGSREADGGQPGAG